MRPPRQKFACDPTLLKISQLGKKLTRFLGDSNGVLDSFILFEQFLETFRS